MVFAVNGSVTGAEVYGSNAIFRKAWPKLLNSASVEAAERTDKSLVAAPSAQAVELFLASAAQPQPMKATDNDEHVERRVRTLFGSDYGQPSHDNEQPCLGSLRRNQVVGVGSAGDPLPRTP